MFLPSFPLSLPPLLSFSLQFPSFPKLIFSSPPPLSPSSLLNSPGSYSLVGEQETKQVIACHSSLCREVIMQQVKGTRRLRRSSPLPLRGGIKVGRRPVVSWGIQSGGREEGLSKGLGRPLASSSLVDHSQDTGFSSDTRSQEDSWWKGDRF